MGMGGMLDILFVASGIYLIFSAISAKKRGIIAVNVMLSKDAAEKDIKDKVGFIEYMYKGILLAGIMIVIAGIIHLVNDYFIHSRQVTWIGIGVIVAAIGIYGITFSRGRKQYMSRQRVRDKQSGKKR